MILSVRSRRSLAYEKCAVRGFCSCFAVDTIHLSIAVQMVQCNFVILSQTRVRLLLIGQREGDLWRVRDTILSIMLREFLAHSLTELRHAPDDTLRVVQLHFV